MNSLRHILITLLLLSTMAVSAQKDKDTTKWYNRTHHLKEVVVTNKKKEKYRRKNNPAVDLMRKVIELKDTNALERQDFYTYDRYTKLTIAMNNLTARDLDSGLIRKLPGAINQVEVSQMSNKLTLPISFNETVVRHYYQRNPQSQRQITTAQREEGLNNLFAAGENFTAIMKDYFRDVNLYQNQVALLHQRFLSPIADGAVSFYRYYITDTVAVGHDRCVHLFFAPNNSQDLGFSGHIYITLDGRYLMRRVTLNIPFKSQVNYVTGMMISQEFDEVKPGIVAKTSDDMLVEMSLIKGLGDWAVTRSTRHMGYNFDRIDADVFEGTGTELVHEDSKKLGDDIWQTIRPVELSSGERNMGQFVYEVKTKTGTPLLRKLLKWAMDGYIGLKDDPKENLFEIGPMFSMLSYNATDGLRPRFGGMTTTTFSPNLHLEGYVTYGTRSRVCYYGASVLYSFKKKERTFNEFPYRDISFSSSQDNSSPGESFHTSGAGTMFTSFRWDKSNLTQFCNRQELRFRREEYNHFMTTLTLAAESRAGRGDMVFDRIRTAEASLEFRFAPGEKTVGTKTARMEMNSDAPIFTIGHTVGFNNLLGSNMGFNRTTATYRQRFWLSSWGRVTVRARAVAQWSEVPYPLLVVPEANTSVFMQAGMFSMMRELEFLNDRYASFHFDWDMNGKLLNRIPFIKKLRWREWIGFSGAVGELTEKNQKAVALFPEGCTTLTSKPYLEMELGIHNIFRIIHINYVRRLTYTNLPGAPRDGVRCELKFSF